MDFLDYDIYLCWYFVALLLIYAESVSSIGCWGLCAIAFQRAHWQGRMVCMTSFLHFYTRLYYCNDFKTFTRFTSFFYFFWISNAKMVHGMYNLDVNLSWSICIGLSFLTLKFISWPITFTILFAQGSGCQIVTATISFFKCVLTWHCWLFIFLMDCLLMFLYDVIFVSYSRRGLFICENSKIL